MKTEEVLNAVFCTALGLAVPYGIASALIALIGG